MFSISSNYSGVVTKDRNANYLGFEQNLFIRCLNVKTIIEKWGSLSLINVYLNLTNVA